MSLRRQLRAGREERRWLASLALTDHLTGLPNRRAWDETLREMRESAEHTGQPLTVAIMDLDHFKQINGAHGQQVGDQVLRAAAAALREALRGDDFVTRLGGDEFGVLLTGLRDSDAANVIERARHSMPDSLAKADLPIVTASVGFYGMDDVRVRGLSDTDIIAQADAALRRAKSAGRDQCVRAD